MIGAVLVAVVAAIHVWILVMEMFLWETPRIRAVFGTTPDFAAATRVMAANQGLYNGFLAAGLILALVQGIPGPGQGLAHFLLACVIVAGLYGAATAGRRILYVQAAPALLALVAVLSALSLALGLTGQAGLQYDHIWPIISGL
jgi:putative membrane protein